MDCPVCQSTEHTQFTNPNTNAPIFQCVFGVDILECKSCKFVFADFIHPNTINLFYNYFCRSRHTADDFKKLREGARKSGDSQLKTIRPYLPKKLGKVLDYGGGSGEAARLFIPLAEEVYISEMEPRSIEHIKEEPRLKLVNDEDLMRDDYIGFFDLIIFSNVLEHMVYPIGAIQKFSRILAKNAQLFIEVPNEDPWIRATGSMMNQHILYFSVDTFKKLIMREGSFDIENIRTCGPRIEDMVAANQLLHDFDSQLTPNGWVIRAILKNSRPTQCVSSQSFQQDEIDKVLSSLSQSLFKISNQRFYGDENLVSAGANHPPQTK